MHAVVLNLILGDDHMDHLSFLEQKNWDWGHTNTVLNY